SVAIVAVGFRQDDTIANTVGTTCGRSFATQRLNWIPFAILLGIRATPNARISPVLGLTTIGTETCFHRAWMKVSNSSIITKEVRTWARRLRWWSLAWAARCSILCSTVFWLHPSNLAMRRPDAPDTAISKIRRFRSGRCWPSMGLTLVAQNFRPQALH